MDIRKVACMGAASFVGILLITASAYPAHSQPPVVVRATRPDPDVLTARVSFRIADLRSEKGQRSLVRRVRYATHQVCPPNFSLPSLDTGQLECIRNAWDGAKPQIDAAIDRAKNSQLAGSVPMTVTIGIAAAR
jgi:UrcA family protein